MMDFLKYRNAMTVDIMLALTALIGFLFNLRLIKMSLGLCSVISDVLFTISCSLLGTLLFFIIIMIFLRYNNKINTIYNRQVKYSIYILILVNIIGYISALIGFMKFLANLHFFVEDVNNNTKISLKRKLIYVLSSVIFVLLSYIFQIPLWNSSLERVKLKTNGTLDEEGFVIIS